MLIRMPAPETGNFGGCRNEKVCLCGLLKSIVNVKQIAAAAQFIPG